jgi:anthranilate phosphoribosyltransferase
MSGEATHAQIGAFLVALRMKGETVDEIAGMARVMRQHARRVEFEGALLDTCGTGGDERGTFNVSTAAAFVAAAAGARVAKHGNRAMTSRCGSADVLEALGANIDLGPEQVRQCIEEVGVGFMFAQAFHPAMKYAAGPRRELGIRTVFNILGPLCNPAGADRQVLGVADPIKETTPEAIKALHEAGVKVVMLTGDSRVTAEAVGAKIGIDEIHADVSPEDKNRIVRELQETGAKVAMAGDGINDAPALAQADVGIAMGTGTDVAMESAGVTLVKGDLRGVARARRLSQATMRNIRQNLFFAFIYNALGVPVAAGVLYPVFGLLLSPMIAAAAMSFSSVSVIGNALRLRGAKL